LASKFGNWWVTPYQYNAYLVAVLVCGAVDGADRLDRRGVAGWRGLGGVRAGAGRARAGARPPPADAAAQPPAGAGQPADAGTGVTAAAGGTGAAVMA